MTKLEIQAEALRNARANRSMVNYPAIYSGFTDKGIPEASIEPRVNVFTFNAWKALGRVVKKGEHGVRIVTYIPVPEKKDADGDVIRPAGRRPKSTTVFHVSQTQAA